MPFVFEKDRKWVVKSPNRAKWDSFTPIKEYLDFVFIVRGCFSKLLGKVPVEGRFRSEA